MFRPIVLSFVLLASCSFSDGTEPIEPAAAVRAAYRTAVDLSPCPGEDDDTASARLSIARARAMADLPALRCDALAGTAAKAHCAYIQSNGGVLTHFEVAGKPGFTGVTFEDRLACAKFVEKPAGEVLANISGATVIEGARGFLNSVYHRAPFLRAETTSFGYGHMGDCAVIDFGRLGDSEDEDDDHDDALVLWPPDGATNVATSFHAAGELPNPVPGSNVVGSPVSLIRTASLANVSATLRGPTGALPFTLVTKATDAAGLVRAGEVHLVPKSPFAKHTTYVVRFSFGANAAKTTTVQTSFTTGGE